MAFPGSMIGALCCGLMYKALRNRNDVAAIAATLVAEMLTRDLVYWADCAPGRCPSCS